MKITIIVTTYNRPAGLKLCLQALAQQVVLPDEVVVADDGSTADTGKIISDLKAVVPYVLKHAWQEDIGFRAAMVRNRAVGVSSGEYLIFIDGDCLVSKHFLANHLKFSEQGRFVTGNRILLSPKFTSNLEIEGLSQICRESLVVAMFQRFRGNFNRVLPMLRLPDGVWRNKHLSRHWQGVKTCNMAVFREDFIKINGFDESYKGWGHEDADLAVRLFSSGILRKDGRWGTVVFHLWHEENDRTLEAENRKKLNMVIANGENDYYANQGVSRYLNETKK